MTVTEQVDLLFKVLGKKGQNWTPHGGCCLVSAQSEAFKDTGLHYPLMSRILAKLKQSGWDGPIGPWNDRQTWPTIRRLLNSIKYRKPFRV